MQAPSSIGPLAGGSIVALSGLVPACLYIKLEGDNPTGSIKIKSALAMIDDAEASGRLSPGRNTLIETSSGNMALAMSAICASRGYGFICVTDPNANAAILRGIKAYGGQVVLVDQRDANDGYVATRVAEIRRRLDADPRLVWLDQYANPANARAHARLTAREILDRFDRLDWLFVGVGTGGTLMGCAEVLAQERPQTRIVAVDPVGSVSFGGTPGRRMIPGIGNSRRPDLLDPRAAHHVARVEELDAIAMCRSLARDHGLLLGGSSGSVLAAVRQMHNMLGADDNVVAISPDFGDRYLETIYCDEWVRSRFGDRSIAALSTVR